MGPLMVLSKMPIKNVYFENYAFFSFLELDYTYTNRSITLSNVVHADFLGFIHLSVNMAM